MKNKLLTAVLLMALVCCGENAPAFYYKQYTTSNGLISNTVYHAYRDSKGYMWFFTDKGVSKYDGTNFKNFTVFDGLSDDDAFCGAEDNQGRLWIFSSNGSPCFIKNDTIYNPGNHALLKKLPRISFMISMLDRDSSLYIAGNKGQIIKITGDNFKYIVKNPLHHLFSLVSKKDTIIAYGSNITYYLYNDRVVRTNQCEVNDNFHDSKGLLKALYAGIELYENDRPVWKLKDSTVDFLKTLHIYNDGAGSIFCCTKHGLVIINRANLKKNVLFDHFQVSSVAQDLSGNYWVTTLDHGLYCLNKELDNIRSLPQLTNYQPAPLNNGQMFFVTNGSIYNLVNRDSVMLQELQVPFKTLYEPVFINDNYFLYKDHHSLYIQNRKTHGTTRIDEFRYLYPISADTMLAITGEQSGRIVLSPAGASVIATFNTRIQHKNIYHDGTLFYDRENKLYAYDIRSGNIALLDSLNYYQSIHKIYYFNDQLIVITNDQKIILYDPLNGYRKHTISDYPFICYEIHSLQAAANRNKYILNTNKGYYIVDDLKNLKTDCRKPAYPARASDLFAVYTFGRNIICNINGAFYIFNDSLIEGANRQPIFYIENVMLNGRRISLDHSVVNYSARNQLSITLNSLKFENTNNTYQYKIIRKNEASQWYGTVTDKLDILLEKDGDYSIEIRAVTESQIASQSRFISFSITPPFYRTIAFSVIVGIILSLMMYAGVVLYNRHRRKVFENELDYLQLEHKAINSLLNPHFIFNAINNIQNLINIDSKETANNYLVVLSRLIRQNIENLHFSFIPVSKELNLVRNYILLQNLRFADRIKLNVNDIPTGIEEINIPPLLIHTFVENSVIHGFKNINGEFIINVDLSLSTNGYLIINITDNGTGIAPQKKERALPDKLSLGIEFIRKRLGRISSFYNVDFSLEINNIDKPGITGTEVIIILYAGFKDEQGTP